MSSFDVQQFTICHHVFFSVDRPKVPSVSVSPSAEIVEGCSVTLTCSSDSNPAATYTWYKDNEAPLRQPAVFVFKSIRRFDSGQYYCEAENDLGRRRSEYLHIDVKYPPKVPSVSVSPSAEIVEGSSVTLTCSSDSNPAANYTWYKENKTLIHEGEKMYFTSIRPENRGVYYCKSQNQYGHVFSSVSVDVHYRPKVPSVSVSPSAKIVEGSSVTLTCSSDSNPAAHYTWYKENEDAPKASGQIFTIINIRSEHSGNYYCEAQNTRGRQNSTLQLTVVAVTAFALALTLIPVLLCIMRRDQNRKENKSEKEEIQQASFTNTVPIFTTVIWVVRENSPSSLRAAFPFFRCLRSVSGAFALYDTFISVILSSAVNYCFHSETR
ncbi:hypothetical protein Q5P01_000560 [Channa striata]|uniref:Ig-like domain-containing protein n=1 Tax=Channa striata TaxID=64152 RepID=A0AA88IJJ1_CHASR|nr:hypothetical protein Q5P01_000560 [Channa striata]